MKLCEFRIGERFRMSGHKYLCTDIGTRTIVAIRLSGISICKDGNIFKLTEEEARKGGWLSGPPYALAECVLDENDIPAATPESSDKDKRYRVPVKFTKTGQYGCGPDDEDDVYTVRQFRKFCRDGAFIDYDGFGYPVKGGKADETVTVSPSNLEAIPKDATHVVWYNR